MSRLSTYVGNWYAVPLPSGGFAAVLVARASSKGVLLGYFFGPRRNVVPCLEDLHNLCADDAVEVMRFGDPGITDGEWPLIGSQSGWNPADWPMPEFAHQDPLAVDRWFITRYPDDDPNGVPQVIAVDAVTAAGLPGNGMNGHLLVEDLLDVEAGPS